MTVGLTSGCVGLTVTSCIMMAVALIFHVVAFATPGWVESDGTSPFQRFGYHEACFDNCMDPYCPGSSSGQIVYDGCAWLYDWYFREVWWWLMPDWFPWMRNLSTINVPIICIGFIVLCVCAGFACAARVTTETRYRREQALHVLLYIAAAIVLVAVIINTFVLTGWYVNGFTLSWMPMPEKNHFGYAFWLDFTATLLMILSVLGSLLAAIFKTILMHTDKDPRYSEDMMYGGGR